MSCINIDLSLEDEVYERLIELSDEEGIPIEALIEQIIIDYCFDENGD